ncbi:MAG: AAA family ATPase [Cellvibrio sp.]|uniref:AAA family ATPase n=1 Tax=Cellvibrio sp. TaxID=1965322 RepID=UPI0031A51B04
MTREPPLRAQPDSRLLDHGDSQQGYLFAESDDDQAEDKLLADYRQRYGLSEDPFAHDYSFPLFTGAGRRQLLDQLLHLCQFSNSVVTVLGEYGVGKTRIAHAFMDSLSDQDQICFLSLSSGQSLEQILLSIIQSFGIDTNGDPSTENLLASLEAFIAEEAVTEDDGLAVVVLDNAHLLDDQSISVLASLLSNFPQQNRLHLALFAEPELMPRLDRLSPESLLINDFQVQPFGLLETVDYLNFRMEMADYLGPEIFTEAMVDPWWRQTRGQLNVLHELAQERLLESVTPAARSHKRPLPVVHIVAISMLIAVVGVVFLYMGDEDEVAESSSAPVATSTPVPGLVPQPAQQSAPQPAVASSAPQATSATDSNRELASTQTPVQPLMQSLPQPVQPNQQPQPATQSAQPAQTTAASTAVNASDDFPREKVVPLAQLPTAQPQKVESTPVAASVPVAQPQVNSTPVQSAQSQPAEVKAAPKPEVAKPTAKPQVATAASGSTQERNILTWKPNEFTIQLLGVSNEKAARDFVAAQANKKDLLVFKSKRAGKDWFVVIAGRYASSAQARQAIAGLPAAQRDAGPWPRDIKTIQSEIRSAM